VLCVVDYPMQHHICCFHNLVWRHYSGEMSKFITALCENSSGSFFTPKLSKSVHCSPSYSKYKKRTFLKHSVCARKQETTTGKQDALNDNEQQYIYEDIETEAGGRW